MKKIQFEKDEDIIDIRYDKIFKAVFTRETEASRIALSRLVSALIGKDVTIVTILANDPPVGNTGDRAVSLDINCRTKDNELVDVEMCFNPNTYEPVRLEYYIGKLFIRQDISGKDKSYNDIKRAYQISILAKDRFFPDDSFFHSFEYYDPEKKISLNGRSRIITVELYKVKKIVEKPIEKMDSKEFWAVFFEYLTDMSKRDKINKILENEEGIAMAGEVLMTISRDDEEWARLLSDEKAELDWQSRMVTAEQRGEQRGEIKRQELTARNAIAEGLPDEVIQRITGLDLEKIISLRAKS